MNEFLPRAAERPLESHFGGTITNLVELTPATSQPSVIAALPAGQALEIG